LVHGQFAASISDLIISKDIPITSVMQTAGSQISLLRQYTITKWMNEYEEDWILILDSDIVAYRDKIKVLWDVVQSTDIKIISGLYFINKLGIIQPALFNKGTENEFMTPIYPIPENKLIKVDYAGMGCILIHRDIIKQIVDKLKTNILFREDYINNQMVGEDTYFFKMVKDAGIQLYAHTGAHVDHIKTYRLNIGHYNNLINQR
jgi:hypothetical protein